MAVSGQSKAETTRRNKESFITLASRGMRLKDIEAEVGVPHNTYLSWRARDPEFKTRFDVARNAHLSDESKLRVLGDGDYDGRFASFRRIYMHHDTFYSQEAMVNAIESCPPMGIVMILCPPESGKLLPDDTPIPTPSGWRKFGEVEPGDAVFAADGTPTTVTAVHREATPELRRVTFSDGTHLDACVDHRWFVKDRRREVQRSPRRYWTGVVSTADIEAAVKDGSGRRVFAVPVADAFEMPDADLPVDPWLLGYWLGNGHVGTGVLTTHADDLAWVAKRVADAGFAYSATICERDGGTSGRVYVNGLTSALAALGVRDDKHVPLAYLWASVAQRRALLAGMLDADGYAGGSRGSVELCFCDAQLADDAEELIRGLGVKLRRRYVGAAGYDGKVTSIRHRLTWTMHNQAFTSPRKVAMWSPAPPQADRLRWRYVESVEPIPSRPGRCITVEHPDHLYVAGEHFIVTHNTTTLVDYLCKRIGEDPNIRVLYASGRQQHVRKQLRKLKTRMTDARSFSAFITRFGPFQPDSNDKLRPWREDAITVAESDHDESDFTFEARSITSEVVGGRADIMILDDLQSRQTLNQTETIVERVRQDYISRLGSDSILVIIGTRVGPGDVYEAFEREGIIDRVVRLAAVDDTKDAEPCPHEEGTCDCRKNGWHCEGRCLARHPNGEMVPHYPPIQVGMVGAKGIPHDAHFFAMKRRQVGEVAFARNYQQKGVAKGDATFDEKLTERIKDGMRPLGLSFAFVRRLGGEAALHNIAGLDPALVGGVALTTASCTPKNFHVIDCHQESNVGRPEAIVQMVRFAAETYGLSKLIVEVNAYQKAFAEEFHEGSINALAAEYGFMVIPHTTGLNKLDDDLGVAAMATNMRMGEIDVAWGDELAVERIGALIDELHMWRPGVKGTRLRQDRVMSMWFAYLEWQRSRRSLAQKSSEWGRAGMPGPMTDYTSLFRPGEPKGRRARGAAHLIGSDR